MFHQMKFAILALCLSRTETMKSHARSADLALSMGMITHNIHKALVEPHLLVLAADSAGFDMTNTANQTAILALKEIEMMMAWKDDRPHFTRYGPPHSRSQPRASTASVAVNKAVDSAEESAKKYNKALLESKKGALGTVAAATAVLLGKWFSGQAVSFNDALSAAAAVVPAIIGIWNAPLALAVTSLFSFVTQLIGGGESEVQKMAKELRKEAAEWIQLEAVNTQLAELQGDFANVVEEMSWVPAVLGSLWDNTNAKEAKNTLLLYTVMLQHDVARTGRANSPDIAKTRKLKGIRNEVISCFI